MTISAAYGAGGSRVGPMVAERLGVPFGERVMRRSVADRVAGPLAEVSREHQPVGRSLGRLLRQVAGEDRGDTTAEADRDADAAYRVAHEQEIRELVEGGGVLLGRAGAVVLRDFPGAFHVRLTGPAELRVHQAMFIEEIDEPTARWRQATEDIARDAYVRHFYGVDPEDPALYHLTIDSTRLPLEACAGAIAGGVREPAGEA